MENGRLNAGISTKMGTKTTEIPIIVFQIHYKLITVENGGGPGGGSGEKYLKIRSKTGETRCRKITKKVTKTVKIPEIILKIH